ncbi:MAG: type IV secretion system protein [Rhizobiaceae bacterium]
MVFNDPDNIFEREIHHNMKLRERISYGIAFVSIVFGGLAYGAKIVGKPEIIREPYVIYVDQQTGISEHLMQVKPAPIEQRGALIQSSIVKYITERESYYAAGIDERVNSVLARSTGQANASLVRLWSSNISKENYPPKRFGTKTFVTVKVISVKIPREGEAIVRFSKTKSSGGSDTVTRNFEAVIEYKLEAGIEKTLQKVWNNPIGFKVISYNISAENIGAF